MEYETRIERKEEGELVTKCRKEKISKRGKELYSMERERFFNRNGWGGDRHRRKESSEHRDERRNQGKKQGHTEARRRV